MCGLFYCWCWINIFLRWIFWFIMRWLFKSYVLFYWWSPMIEFATKLLSSPRRKGSSIRKEKIKKLKALPKSSLANQTPLFKKYGPTILKNNLYPDSKKLTTLKEDITMPRPSLTPAATSHITMGISWLMKIWSSRTSRKKSLYGSIPIFVKITSKSTFLKLQRENWPWLKVSSTI